MEDNNIIDKMQSTMSIVEIDNENDEESEPPEEELCLFCFYPSSSSNMLQTPNLFFESTCNCNYKIHERCLTKWIRSLDESNYPRRCPYCNVEVKLTDIYDEIITPSEIRVEQPEADINAINDRLIINKLYLKNLVCAIFMVLMLIYLFWFLVS